MTTESQSRPSAKICIPEYSPPCLVTAKCIQEGPYSGIDPLSDLCTFKKEKYKCLWRVPSALNLPCIVHFNEKNSSVSIAKDSSKSITYLVGPLILDLFTLSTF